METFQNVGLFDGLEIYHKQLFGFFQLSLFCDFTDIGDDIGSKYSSLTDIILRSFQPESLLFKSLKKGVTNILTLHRKRNEKPRLYLYNLSHSHCCIVPLDNLEIKLTHK